MLMGGGTLEGGEAVVMHCNGWRGEWKLQRSEIKWRAEIRV